LSGRQYLQELVVPLLKELAAEDRDVEVRAHPAVLHSQELSDYSYIHIHIHITCPTSHKDRFLPLRVGRRRGAAARRRALCHLYKIPSAHRLDG
jgi:hypothetical protein